jgi:ferredoxin
VEEFFAHRTRLTPRCTADESVAARDYSHLMRVRVDEASCQGQQMCSIAAPEVFGSDELGHATVLIAGDIPEHLQTKTRRAQANCPEDAIIIEE